LTVSGLSGTVKRIADDRAVTARLATGGGMRPRLRSGCGAEWPRAAKRRRLPIQDAW